MRRTIPILSGLAILVVLLNHSAWHVLEDFVPGRATLAQALPFIIVDQFTRFAVPAFVFIAGYFISYATSEGRKDLKWSVVQARLSGLAWPWIGWTLLLTVLQIFLDKPLTFGGVVYNLFIQYYFIPLLLFYYLSSIFVVRWVKQNPRLTLILAGAVQVSLTALWYLRLYLPGYPGMLNTMVDIGPLQWLRFAFYFPLGVLTGMRCREVRAWLEPVKRWLPLLILITLGLATAETANAYMMGGSYYPYGGDQTKLTSVLFSMSFILTFVAYERINLPLSHAITYIGMNTFGYYLSHYIVLGVLGRALEAYLPWVASNGWLLMPVLFFLVILICSAMMESVKRLPVRRFYRYVFG